MTLYKYRITFADGEVTDLWATRRRNAALMAEDEIDSCDGLDFEFDSRGNVIMQGYNIHAKVECLRQRRIL